MIFSSETDNRLADERKGGQLGTDSASGAEPVEGTAPQTSSLGSTAPTAEKTG